MMTLEGTHVGLDFGAPSLRDIALGLSRMPRFGGQTLFEWTVADHVVCATNLLRDLIALGLSLHDATRLLPLHVLLHDAHEAMTGDIPTTFKTGDMKTLQAKLDDRLYTALGIPMPNDVEVRTIKSIDSMMLLAEAKVCTPTTTYDKICEELEDIARPFAVDIIEQHIHSGIDAREKFLEIANNYIWRKP